VEQLDRGVHRGEGRHHDERHLGPPLVHHGQQPAPIHPRHHQVREDDVDLAALLQHLDRGVARAGLEGRPAVGLQHRHQQLALSVVVFDHQDAAGLGHARLRAA